MTDMQMLIYFPVGSLVRYRDNTSMFTGTIIAFELATPEIHGILGTCSVLRILLDQQYIVPGCPDTYDYTYIGSAYVQYLTVERFGPAPVDDPPG